MPDLITILAEVVEWKEEIDIERARLSADRVKKWISEHPDNLDVARNWKKIKKSFDKNRSCELIKTIHKHSPLRGGIYNEKIFYNDD